MFEFKNKMQINTHIVDNAIMFRKVNSVKYNLVLFSFVFEKPHRSKYFTHFRNECDNAQH